MALDIVESFEVAAPIETVWAFLNDPNNVVACMPGASLNEIVDESQFIGSVKMKIGAVSAQYQGTITYTERDADNHVVKMLATGNERGGGTVSGTIITRLESKGSNLTRIACESSIDLTGKIIQVGRGMIEGVSQQIIKKYITNVRKLLETSAAETAANAGTTETGTGAAAPASPAVPEKEDSINIVAVVLKVIGKRIADFFRRLFGIR